MADTADNPYLSGNFAPVAHEETAVRLEVLGAIPEFLDGRYVRNGPNPIGQVDPEAYHWFLGDGMVHGVRLRGGRAEWYRNRWIRSRGAAAALGVPAPRHRESAGAPGLGANTNVIRHAGRTLALVEAGIACYELDEELGTVGAHDFGLIGGYTAHPKLDPVTGDLHAVSYHFGRGNTVQHSVIGADGTLRRTTDIRVGGSPLMHDFGLTRSHVVLLDLPVTFDARKAVKAALPAPLRLPARAVLSAVAGRVRLPDPLMSAVLRKDNPRARRGRNHDLPYSWDSHYPARIGVLPREGGVAQWFEVEPCYVFHTLGAYEEVEASGDTVVVLDAVCHPHMFRTDPHGPSGGSPWLNQWRLNLRTGRVTETVLDDQEQELPRVDERRTGDRHRYAYTVAVAGHAGVIGDAVIRHDLHTGGSTRRSLGPTAEGGEFAFVPRHEGAAEGDGVLMGFVHDRDGERSRLVILDATSLDTVAEVLLPVRVPHGNHGNWIPAEG